MSNPQILPEEWIADSLENYLSKRHSKTNIIYVVVMLSVAVFLILLPFIYVDISVEGSGDIRPWEERNTLSSPVTEIIDRVYAKEGDFVKKGQPILRFRTNSTDTKIDYQETRLEDYRSQCHDLEYLAKGTRPSMFEAPNREQEYMSFIAQTNQIKSDIRNFKTEWLRNKVLYDEKMISEEEYNKYYYQYLDKTNELKTTVEGKLAIWQTDLNSLRNQLRETKSNIKGDEIDKRMFILNAPVSGTLESFSGIYPGMPVQAGTQLAVISPQSSLYVEAFVKPKDIAFIRQGMPAKIQIDAFNYNEWGMLEGKVESISSDCIIDQQNNYLFKVRVKLDGNYLTLKKTGRKGFIKKGMTAIVHFMVTRRSLFDLLYQSMDAWVNPTQYINNDKEQNK